MQASIIGLFGFSGKVFASTQPPEIGCNSASCGEFVVHQKFSRYIHMCCVDYYFFA